MATPKVVNAQAIAAAQAQNTAAAAGRAQATAKATAAQAVLQPIAQKTIPGISALTAGINAKIAELSGTSKTGSYNPITGGYTSVQSSSQLVQQSRDILGAITPTEIATGNTAAADYQKALADAASFQNIDVPGAIYEEDKTTTTNLSEEAFINTLKLLMGSAEASKPYVKQLYTLVSKYYKSGSTIPDSINLALYDAEENKLIPEFTTRFSGIFKLRDRRTAGEVIDVPTIAEYIKSQEGIAEVLRNTGLKDLANETFLNQVMGTGKSVFETTKIITDVYDAINNAPKEWYDMVQAKMPFATKPDLAKALLLGAEGAADLERKVNKYGIMAAAQGQGLTVTEAAAGELLTKGQGYTSSKPKFGQAAAIIPLAKSLTSIESGGDPTKTYTQEQAFSAVFDQNYQALQNIENLSEREKARYSAQVGKAQNALASQNRMSGSGQY